MAHPPQCRACRAPLSQLFVDLGYMPLANNLLSPAALSAPETQYPLRAYVCGTCYLVQLQDFASPTEIFSDYVYFSGYSDTAVRQAAEYTQMMVERFGVNRDWEVVELASNDGSLLQFFQEREIPILGIEPALNVATCAEQKGIPTLTEFFGQGLAQALKAQGYHANLMIANNVIAHVPDVNDFVRGIQTLLHPEGILTVEFPHLVNLINARQFDTIYHEHFSYFSLLSISEIFSAHDLTIFDLEELPCHGGSLRLFVTHQKNTRYEESSEVHNLLAKERAMGLGELSTYNRFSQTIFETKFSLIKFLLNAKAEGKTVVAYGAPAKGNTLLNYCGVGPELIEYAVDRNPHKQNSYLPGSHIPIFAPEKLFETRPDYVLVLPWNLWDEISDVLMGIQAWGGQAVLPVPETRVVKWKS